MKLFTFPKGGIHPHEHKDTAASGLKSLDLPDTVYVPMVQHIGAPALPVVQVGDKVKVGTLIGKEQGHISAPIHSPVSGTVTKIDTILDASGIRRPAVIIKREGDEWEPAIVRNFDLVSARNFTPDEIVQKIHDGGLVGKGGATFPTRVKYMVPPGKMVDTLLINGVECEPYLTSDHELMLDRPEEVILGADLLRYTLGTKLAVICIEANKPDAIALLQKKVRDMGLEAPADYLKKHLSGKGETAQTNPDRSGYIAVVALKVKYPQGAEKQLIRAVLGREVPSGKLPLDVGVIVNNVATAHSAYKIIQKNKPMVERIVTIAGEGVKKPGNYKIRTGMSLRDVLTAVDGLPEGDCKILLGGPMMGKAVSNLDVPVTKGTSGILVLPAEKASRNDIGPCIRCASCIKACPMGLEPYLLEKLVELKRLDDAQSHAIRDCVECGSCSFVCPSNRPLLDMIRLGKAQLLKAAKK